MFLNKTLPPNSLNPNFIYFMLAWKNILTLFYLVFGKDAETAEKILIPGLS